MLKFFILKKLFKFDISLKLGVRFLIMNSFFSLLIGAPIRPLAGPSSIELGGKICADICFI